MDSRFHGEPEMTFNRALVIGSSGQVSRALAAELSGREVLFTSTKGGEVEMDLGDPRSIERAFAAVDARWGDFPAEVFLAGAMTHVDKCEQEQDRCIRVNRDGPAQVAAAAKARGYGLTYFSTEYVFGGAEYEGGEVGPFSEEARPHPTSVYGRSKLEAEQAVLREFGSSALIARTTMIFSWDPNGMNFFMQYLRQLEATAAGRAGPFRVPVDQISTPTYAPALAQAAVELRDLGASGIFNLVGSDLLSRQELVTRVAQRFGFGPEIVAKGFQFVKTADLGQLALRPLTAGLTVDKALRAGVRVDGLEKAFTAILALRGH
jgi:dTDP-4-dehydrorhamnose reductase